MKPLDQCRLYAFVDTSCLRGRAPETVARQLCEGGADLIQLRAKQSSPDEILRMAEAILPVTRAAGVGLVINDHLRIAQGVGAEFCHLGQEDFFGRTPDPSHLPGDGGSLSKPLSVQPSRSPSPLPSPLGRGRPDRPRIGLSTHAPEEAQRAVEAGADYLGVGPVFATSTKPEARPVTLEYVRWAAEQVKIPWFAIGGINLDNLDQVLAAGAKRICVVSAILNADDVAGACRQFKKRLGRAF
jgi:thiamine-phosphate pyrophosphorylase